MQQLKQSVINWFIKLKSCNVINWERTFPVKEPRLISPSADEFWQKQQIENCTRTWTCKRHEMNPSPSCFMSEGRYRPWTHSSFQIWTENENGGGGVHTVHFHQDKIPSANVKQLWISNASSIESEEDLTSRPLSRLMELPSDTQGWATFSGDTREEKETCAFLMVMQPRSAKVTYVGQTDEKGFKNGWPHPAVHQLLYTGERKGILLTPTLDADHERGRPAPPICLRWC